MIDMTTTARVKAFAALGGVTLGTDLDTAVAFLVTKYSALAERVMDRHAESADRTEQYDVLPDQTAFFLRGYPVTTGGIITFEVRDDASRLFTGSAWDSTDYYLDTEAGILYLDWAPWPGRGALQVKYRGGMAYGADAATKTAAFVAAYPDVAQAIDEQVAYLLQRKDSLGATSISIAGSGVSHDGQVGWLKHSQDTLLSRQRLVF